MEIASSVSIPALVLAGLLALGVAAGAENAVPDRLIIGYDGEGKVDASPQACLASVKEVTEWDKAATEKGAREVCAARRRHLDAYAALQASYRNFVKAYSVDRRLDLAGAATSLKALVKSCIEHKHGLTTGGHNIRIDIIENDITTDCLILANNLIRDETAKYNALR
jgi:hypothetical protein